VLVETDSLVGYYLARLPAAPAVTDAADLDAVAEALAGAPQVAGDARRDQRRGSQCRAIRAALASATRPPTPAPAALDPTYVRYKELLRRPAQPPDHRDFHPTDAVNILPL
jgi:hypothetical protein